MLTLQQYMNQFTRLEHTAEMRRLRAETGLTRQFFHSVATGKAAASLTAALAVYKATHGRVDPRTMAVTTDWGALDAYYRQEQGLDPPASLPKALARAGRARVAGQAGGRIQRGGRKQGAAGTGKAARKGAGKAVK